MYKSFTDYRERGINFKEDSLPSHLTCSEDNCESDDSGCPPDLRQDLNAAIKGNDNPGVKKILDRSAWIHKDTPVRLRGVKHDCKAIQWAIEQAVDQNRLSILGSLLEIAKKSGRLREISKYLDSTELPILFRSKSPEAVETLLVYLPRPNLKKDTDENFMIHCIREGIVINKEVAVKLKSLIGIRCDKKLPIEEGKLGYLSN